MTVSDPALESVIWVDNYSHENGRTKLKVGKPDYLSQMWTAEARCLVAKGSQPLRVALCFADNKLVSIMPSELFVYLEMAAVFSTCEKHTRAFHHEQTFCARWNIRSNPPRPDPRKLSDQLQSKILEQSQFMRRFLPSTLHDYNIGANSGLSRFARSLHDLVTTGHDSSA